MLVQIHPMRGNGHILRDPELQRQGRQQHFLLLKVAAFFGRQFGGGELPIEVRLLALEGQPHFLNPGVGLGLDLRRLNPRVCRLFLRVLLDPLPFVVVVLKAFRIYLHGPAGFGKSFPWVSTVVRIAGCLQQLEHPLILDVALDQYRATAGVHDEQPLFFFVLAVLHEVIVIATDAGLDHLIVELTGNPALRHAGIVVQDGHAADGIWCPAHLALQQHGLIGDVLGQFLCELDDTQQFDLPAVDRNSRDGGLDVAHVGVWIDFKYLTAIQCPISVHGRQVLPEHRQHRFCR